MAESVRAALTLVARQEAVLGIVYATDAKVEPGVKIVGTFPADSHPADHLSCGGGRRLQRPKRRDYLAFLRTSAAKAIFEKYGVLVSRQPNHLKRVFDISPTEWVAIQLSLRVATVATLVATPIGIAVAWPAGAA